MAHFKAKNIGPVKEVDFPINRINIFLGPQSSGKSTIAKILSFCQWAQKDIVEHQGCGHMDLDYLRRNLFEYHNLESFFSEESMFEYKGRCANLKYERGIFVVTPVADLAEAVVSKNAYIPSERNIVGIPQSFSMNLPENYLRSFLSDWLDVRDKFRAANPVEIMNLGVSYFYDVDSHRDMISMEGREKPITLSQASSGLQSVTPLFIYLKYLTEWIYKNKEARSPERLQLIRETSARTALSRELENLWENPEFKMSLEEMSKDLASLDITKFNTNSESDIFNRLKEITLRLIRPSFTNIVIEEPEQNLFPQTQAVFIYALLAMIKSAPHNVIITTHSPFIIYAINNCMMAYVSREKLSKLPHLNFTSDSAVDPAQVSVWELRDGYLQAPDKKRNETIQGEDGLIRGNYFDRTMKSLMADFKNLMAIR